MIALHFFNFDHRLVFEFVEFSFPVTVEFLQLFISNVDVFFQLHLLDVGPELVLILVKIRLKKSYFSHQILIELVFLNHAQLFSKNCHLFFNKGEN